MDLISVGSRIMRKGTREGNAALAGLGAAAVAYSLVRRLYRGRELLWARTIRPGSGVRIRVAGADEELEITA